MRVNIYSQELTGDIDRVTKIGPDSEGKQAAFHAIRLYLHSAEELHHTPEDDDRSAVTLWLPRSLARRIDLAIALRAMAAWAEGSWPGGWAGWQDGPEGLAVKADREHAAELTQAGDAGRAAYEVTEAAREAEAGWPGVTVESGGPDACPVRAWVEGQPTGAADRSEAWARGELPDPPRAQAAEGDVIPGWGDRPLSKAEAESINWARGRAWG